MKVSVIIPTHDDGEDLSHCLDSLNRSTEKIHEIIVVDDASSTQILESIDRFDIRYIRLSRNRGPAAARNEGADVATGDILFFIDADVRVREDTIKKIKNAHAKHGIVVYQGIAAKKSTDGGFGADLLALKWYHMLHGILESSFVHSHAFSIKKDAFRAIGGFNESFTPPGFGEEFELGTRLRERHVLHTDPELIVDHHFTGYWQRARALFHRSHAWARVFFMTGRLEKANASLQEILTGIFSFLSLTFLMFTFSWLPFILVALSCFLITIFLNLHFYKFVSREKGLGFMLASIIPINVWATISLLGGVLAITKYLIGLENPYNPRNGGFLDQFLFRFNSMPSHLVFFVTDACNARCKHCFYWNHLTKEEPETQLDLSEIATIAEKYGRLKMLTITGGEPTLRKDLASIILQFHARARLEHVSLHTNALLPQSLIRMVKEVCKRAPGLEFNISVSIDGLKATHDEIRGVPGSFEKAITLLEHLILLRNRYPQVNVTVNTCFVKQNEDEIKHLVEFIHENYRIDGHYLSLVRGTPRDGTSLDVNLARYARVVSLLNKKRRMGTTYRNYILSNFRNQVDALTPRHAIFSKTRGTMPCKCLAGETVAVLYPDGRVAPCESMDIGFGNLKEHGYSMEDVLGSKRASETRGLLEAEECSCTWECALMNNIIFNWRLFPQLLVGALGERVRMILRSFASRNTY
ncbi:glycosyltransferase [Candidatus Bathyarchaeota archaeon]|nr:glycosyltransferase [Candidatus Bathyarchaeota archaeon]